MGRHDPHHDAELMLPWYVNGTLDREERAAVEAHLEGSAALREALAAEERLASAIKNSASAELSREAAFAKLERRLDRPTPLVRALAYLRGLARPLVLAPMAVAAAALVLVVMPTQDAPYRTLTDGAEGAPMVRILLAEEAAAGTMADIAARHGLTIVEGPSEGGVYTLRLDADSDPAPLEEALAAEPLIEFVTTQE